MIGPLARLHARVAWQTGKIRFAAPDRMVQLTNAVVG